MFEDGQTAMFDDDAKRETVALVKSGHSVAEAARIVGVQEFRAKKWISTYAVDGLDGVLERPDVGYHERAGAMRMTDAQHAYVSACLARGPQAFGLGDHGWTSRNIISLIHAELGLKYTRGAIDDLLNRIGYVWTGLPLGEGSGHDYLRKPEKLAALISDELAIAEKRVRAMELLDSGTTLHEAAHQLDVSRASLSNWRRIDRRSGREALRTRRRGSPASSPSLDPATWDLVRSAIRSGPQTCGLEGDWWSDGRLADAIERIAGVRFPTGQAAWLVDLFGTDTALLDAVCSSVGRGWLPGPTADTREAVICRRCRRAFVDRMRHHLCELVPLRRHFRGQGGAARRRFNTLMIAFRELGDFTLEVDAQHLRLLAPALIATARVRLGRVELDLDSGSRAEGYADVGKSDPIDGEFRASIRQAWALARRVGRTQS